MDDSRNIPMRGWHCKVAHNVFFCVPSFLMTYEHVASTFYASYTGHNSWIIIPCTISVEFHPLNDI